MHAIWKSVLGRAQLPRLHFAAVPQKPFVSTIGRNSEDQNWHFLRTWTVSRPTHLGSFFGSSKATLDKSTMLRWADLTFIFSMALMKSRINTTGFLSLGPLWKTSLF